MRMYIDYLLYYILNHKLRKLVLNSSKKRLAIYEESIRKTKG